MPCSRLALCLVCLCSVSLFADEKKSKPEPKDDLVKRPHTLQLDSGPIDIVSTAGTIVMKGDDEKPKAEVFFVAYTKSDKQSEDAAEGNAPREPRPITFCFNGGPGSSSVWLHMGLAGPMRVRFAEDASIPKPPYTVEANPFSLLDVSDLVFIDPVSTGYSRPVEGQDKKQFHGYREDIASVGEFIHLYMNRYERWADPVYLMGESYGTMRAAGLAGHLQQRYNLNLSGIILVSAVLDFQTIRFGETNDLPYALFLPAYAATAWYHQRLGDDLQAMSLEDFCAEVRSFVETDYMPALFMGEALSDEKRNAVVAGIAKYTGLSEEYVDRSQLRIRMSRFGKEVLRGDLRTVGRFDSRYVGVDRDAVGDTYEYDASAAALFAAFTSGLNQHLRDGLGVKKDRPYEILTGKVHPWNYSEFQNAYVSSLDTLREAMTKNPALRVFVANGYYDLATPFYATEYSFRHLMLPEPLRKNVRMEYYEAGHMMYVHEPSLEAMHEHLTEFYAE